jgi:hypothetical protein
MTNQLELTPSTVFRLYHPEQMPPQVVVAIDGDTVRTARWSCDGWEARRYSLARLERDQRNSWLTPATLTDDQRQSLDAYLIQITTGAPTC